MRGLTRSTIVEMIDRKTIYIFAAVTAIALLVIIATSSMEFHMNFQSRGNVDMSNAPEVLANPIMHGIASFMSFLIFLVVMATAGIIPSMLIRGRAEYYLSKPLSRSRLLLSKLLSMSIVYGGVLLACGMLCWFMLFLVHGFGVSGLVQLFSLKLISLLIWLAITAFAGIAFGSTAMSLMTTFVVWVIQTILTQHELIGQFINSRPVSLLVDTLYYIFPKMEELSDLTVTMALGRPVESYLPLWSSLLFAVILVWVTVYIFNRKNY